MILIQWNLGKARPKLGARYEGIQSLIITTPCSHTQKWFAEYKLELYRQDNQPCKPARPLQSKEPVYVSMHFGLAFLPNIIAEGLKPHSYLDLPSDYRIRLLILHPGVSNAIIRCDMKVFPPGELLPYEALSYIWGEAHSTR